MCLTPRSSLRARRSQKERATAYPEPKDTESDSLDEFSPEEQWLNDVASRREAIKAIEQNLEKDRRAAVQKARDEEFKARWKFNAKVLCVAAVVLSTWYLTPISDILTDCYLRCFVPISKDVELGEEALKFHGLLHEGAGVWHPDWSPMIEGVGNELVRSNSVLLNEYYDWKFYVLPIPQLVTALCFPDGSIFITTGLIQQVQPTRGELAALVAHEMGHVQRRHAQRRQQKLGVADVFVNVLCFMFEMMLSSDGRRLDHDFRQHLEEAVVSVVGLGEQGFSRRDEYQADATAWELLRSRSNSFNPDSLYTLLAKLHDFEKAAGVADQAASWSSTHPATEARLKVLKKKWDSLSSMERMGYSSNQRL